MFRIVKEVEPRFVFAENVSRSAIDTACNDLESLGYETRAIALSASDVGADHVRKRYWLLAYTDDKSKLLRGIDAKMAFGSLICHRVWASNPTESGMAHGMAYRVERFKAIGNGQVPIVAVCALLALLSD